MRPLIFSVLLLAFGVVVQAGPVTIDFENTVDNGGGPFTVPQGFSVSGFFLTRVTVPQGFPVSPPGGDGESLALLSSYRAYTDLTQVDGLSFDLLSLDVHFECGYQDDYCISDDWIISAYDANDGLIIESNFFPDSYGWATLQFNDDWQDITRLRINTWAGAEGTIGYVDNIAVNVVPIPAAIDIWSTVLHPHHDDENVSPFLDDMIPVIVFGASTLVGDSDDLDTDLIDPATLSFGPGMGAISPSHPPLFNFDIDNDGLDDALFRFLASDAAFDKVTCSDTSGTLAGELTTGETFEGTDSFVSDCNALCH